MAVDLQSRAKAFLERPLPSDLNYVPNSLAESYIRRLAAEGRVDVDPEAAQLLQICAMEAEFAASESGSPARQEYFGETAELLQAILDGDESS